MIAQSLKLAASQQVRNMASLGGNVLQRTRCPYFRDVSYEQCNKRNPGSGCAALDGINRSHAILGTSDQCIASYPGDFAQTLIAMDANVDIAGARGTRNMPFASLHRRPGDAPDIESTLRPGEVLTSFFVPAAGWKQINHSDLLTEFMRVIVSPISAERASMEGTNHIEQPLATESAPLHRGAPQIVENSLQNFSLIRNPDSLSSVRKAH